MGAPGPQHVGIVGTGMVGLATAWFLQGRGVQVTLLEQDHVGAGSSWGNAGWLTPSLTTPLPEPAVLTYGIRAVLSPASPVYVPLRPQLKLLRFLAGFAWHSTHRRWGSACAYAPINALALDAFDRLEEGGVMARTHSADPCLACYRTDEERRVLLEELEQIAAAGQDVKYDVISGEEARYEESMLSGVLGAAITRPRPALHQPARVRGRACRVGPPPWREDRDGGRCRAGARRERGSECHRRRWFSSALRCGRACERRLAGRAGQAVRRTSGPSRPGAGTASAPRPSRCREARSTSRRSGSRVRRCTHRPVTG